MPAIFPVLQNANPTDHAAIVPLRQLANGTGIVRGTKWIAHSGQNQHGANQQVAQAISHGLAPAALADVTPRPGAQA